MQRSLSVAITTIAILFGSAFSTNAGSFSMDDGGHKNGKIEAYVDLYGKAASGNGVALENLRVLSRIYDTETLVEAADRALEAHGILVYPPDAPQVAESSYNDEPIGQDG